MPSRNPAEDSWTDRHLVCDQPPVRYSPEAHPEVAAALNIINYAAQLDEHTACIQYPAGEPEDHRKLTQYLAQAADTARDHGLRVVSFDIDLTIRIGEDYEENVLLIAPSAISELQEMGYIVGTCSDREPSDQTNLLRHLGQQPHFCIPKELLGWTKRLLPGDFHLHVGDHPVRDRQMAAAAGWQHQWPSEFERS